MTTDLSRREFVRGAALVGGAVVLNGPVALAATRRREQIASRGAFSLGVASGMPSPDGGVLWTRLDGLERSAKLYLEIARDPDFRNVVKRATVRAAAVRDYTVHYQARGLKPGSEYFYRFHTKHSDSPVGRLRTLRPADSREPIRIGVFSCQSYEAGFYTAHAGLAAEQDLDFVVCLGDYIYEHHYYDGPPERADKTGVNKDGDVQSLDEYRQKYRLYRSDPNLQAMHAAWPIFPIWDDHEVEDNYAGSRPDTASDDPDRHENDNKTPRRVPYAERQRVGYLSWFEYMPRLRTRPVSTQIYGAVPLGANATLFLTDERQYRSGQPCNDQLAAPCPDATSPSQTLLGEQQREWFKQALAADKATWKLWANEVMAMGLQSAPGQGVNFDGWDGYAAERQNILESCVANGVKNLVALTGDIHTFVAGNLTTTGDMRGTPVGTEFIGGSITSVGLEGTFGPASPGLQAIKANNPHIKYINTDRRGYMVVTAAGERLDVVFRSPATIAAPKSDVTTLASFRVASGNPSVEQLS
jgi:alkaline phosphatase D